MKRNPIVLVFAVFLGHTLISQADAKCTQRALEGKWFGYVTIVNVPNSSNNYSSYCEIELTKKGTLGMTAQCTALSSNKLIDGLVDNLTGSNLTVASDCSVTGTVSSQLGGATEIHGHIDRRQTSFVAAVKNTTGGVGSMSLVR
mgnify:CR=1 FL=1